MKRLVLSLLATMAGVVAGARTIETSFVLTEDADWSDENLEIPSGVTVDLNGHRLAVSTVSGGGTLTDSRRYVALDYVKSTGQQYVKTGYTPGTNTTASLDFTSGAFVNSTVYFGCVWKTQAWMLGLANDSFYFFSGAISVCGFAAERHLRFQIDKKASTSGWARMYDAETNVRLGETSVNLENVNDEKELCVFGTPKGSCSRFSLHAFKVWEAGELVRDYVPARDPDTGRIGLLDRVSGVLSSSDSATALVAGSDVGTVSSVGQVRLVGTTDFPFAQFAGAIPAHLRMTLASDADWSATPTATLAGKLDLDGHVLTVASLAGAGEITDSRRYVALEYAESTGGQRVRTGYVPGVDTQVSLDFVPLSERNKSRFFIGSKWATYSWSFGQTSQSPGFFCFFGGGLNWGDTVTGRRFGLNIDADKKRMTLTDLENGVVYTQQTDLDLKNANGDEMLVFGGNTDDLCGAMRFYSLKIGEGGVPQRDYIPARDPDTSVVGLLDRVNNVLVANEAGTALTAGPDLGAPRSCGKIRFAASGYPLTNFTGSFAAHVCLALADDADWTAQGNLTLPGRLVDLEGHVLKVSGLVGGGEVIDTKTVETLGYAAWDGTQRMGTGVTLDAQSSVDLDFTTGAQIGGEDVIFGSVWTTRAWLFCHVGSDTSLRFFGNNEMLATATAGQHLRFTVGPDDKARLFDGETDARLAETATSRVGNGQETYLFHEASASGSRASKGRLHAFRMWNDGAIQRDFIPARDPETGRVGLFDRVEGVLHRCVSDAQLVPGPRGAAQSKGALRFVLADGSSFTDFTGTVGADVRVSVFGEPVSLASDVDLTGIPGVEIDTTVDLCAHELKLASLAGCGKVVDSGTRTYDLYDYVASSGQQYVKTGFVPGTDTTLELDFTSGSSSSSTIYLGTTWATYSWLFGLAENSFYFFGGGSKLAAFSADRHLRFSVRPGGDVSLTDAETGDYLAHAAGVTLRNDHSDMDFCVFGGGKNNLSSYRLHALRLSNAQGLARDFIPARERATGKIGLLDRVSGAMFTSESGTPLVGGAVTNDAIGRLVVEVAEGAAAVNRTLPLAGSLQLVKRGAGTLTLAKSLQTYSAGTRIESGTVDLLTDPDRITSCGGFRGYLGASGSPVVVGQGAVFDFRGNVDYRAYAITLDGGTLRNGCLDMGSGNGGLDSMSLTDDSMLDMRGDTTYYNAKAETLDLGGHAYSVVTRGKTLHFSDPTTVTAGTLALTGGGRLFLHDTFAAEGVMLRTDGPLTVSGTATVRDYVASATDADANAGGGALNVLGTFRPVTDNFYGCTMRDGSTIDLSTREGAWSTVSAAAGGRTEVTFERGATVTLDLGARPVSGQVMSWVTRPEGVAFELKGAAAESGQRLSIRSDGLYAADGLMILYK